MQEQQIVIDDLIHTINILRESYHACNDKDEKEDYAYLHDFYIKRYLVKKNLFRIRYNRFVASLNNA